MGTSNKDADEFKGNGVVHVNGLKSLSWADHISVLDLSHRKLNSLDENVKFPASLEDLNLSHNSLAQIPKNVIELKDIKRLDVSYNHIQYFDETPNFLNSIQDLNISNNLLAGPPYWVWSESPQKLMRLDISCNPRITESFKLNDGYLKELLQYKLNVHKVVLFNCKLEKYLELLGTLVKTKVLEIGKADLTRFNLNYIEYVPCPGLDKCCDIQKLNLSNTQLRCIEPNINMYKQLQEINLAQNYINCLPNEISELESLETLILTGNNLLYLPDNMGKLTKLKHLHLDSNELCMLPEDLGELPSLELLDLYDNCLNEIPEHMGKVRELDLAQNYFEEPESPEYVEKKERLRLTTDNRNDGCKLQVERALSVYSRDSSIDEELMACLDNLPNEDLENSSKNTPSEEEDWDSDEYWTPVGYRVLVTPPLHPPWYYLVKQMMAEGNFCPMDAHVQPIAEKVALERMTNPKVWVEVEGQFDDLSDDES